MGAEEVEESPCLLAGSAIDGGVPDLGDERARPLRERIVPRGIDEDERPHSHGERAGLRERGIVGGDARGKAEAKEEEEREEREKTGRGSGSGRGRG